MDLIINWRADQPSIPRQVSRNLFVCLQLLVSAENSHLTTSYLLNQGEIVQKPVLLFLVLKEQHLLKYLAISQMVDRPPQKLPDLHVSFDFDYSIGYLFFGRSWINLLKWPGVKVSDMS